MIRGLGLVLYWCNIVDIILDDDFFVLFLGPIWVKGSFPVKTKNKKPLANVNNIVRLYMLMVSEYIVY